MLRGRRLASHLLFCLVCLPLFIAVTAYAASYIGDMTETMEMSDSVRSHKYPPLEEAAALSDVLIGMVFTPRLESLPISETLSVIVYSFNQAIAAAYLSLNDTIVGRKFTPRLESLLISETLSVIVYSFNQAIAAAYLSLNDILVGRKFTPRLEGLPISETLSVAVNGLNNVEVSSGLSLNEALSITGPTSPPESVVTIPLPPDPTPNEPGPIPGEATENVQVVITETLGISDVSDQRKEHHIEVTEELLPPVEEHPQPMDTDLLLKVIGGVLGASALVIVTIVMLKKVGKGTPSGS